MEDLVKRQEIPDVALFSLTSENSYAGLGNDFHLKAWCGVVVSDTMEDIRSMLLANAADEESAIQIFNAEWDLIIHNFEKGDFPQLEKQLTQTAEQLREIPLKHPPESVPTISLVGEIFVRRDELSRQYLTERLAKKDSPPSVRPLPSGHSIPIIWWTKGLLIIACQYGKNYRLYLKKCIWLDIQSVSNRYWQTRGWLMQSP